MILNKCGITSAKFMSKLLWLNAWGLSHQRIFVSFKTKIVASDKLQEMYFIDYVYLLY